MKRFTKTFLCFIYILSAVGLFLYLLFPSVAVQQYVVSRVERSFPGIRLSLSRLQPMLPAGISIASSQLLFKDAPLIRADGIQVNPRLDSLFRPLKRIAFQGNTSGGRFNGTIIFAKNDQIQVDTGLTGVKIEEIPFLQNLNIGGLSGVCDCRIQSGAKGSVTIKLKISECKGAFSSFIPDDRSITDSITDSIPGTESISLQKVMADLDYREGELKIRETIFEGPKINGSISGTVIIKEPFGRSLLKLDGKIRTDRRIEAGSEDRTSMQMLSERNPSAADSDFRIEGTLENPIFSFPGGS
ncbi:MAG: type II secretion system protein GspN [Desulfobacteraceae bacterium]|nr:MAG: type II secretion system protein GspN [Desulfobacteraceae bacterium]